MKETAFGMSEFLALSEEWDEFRAKNVEFVMKSGTNSTFRTWTEVGGNTRYIYEMYGRWHILKSNPEKKSVMNRYNSFEEFFWEETKANLVPIYSAVKDYIKWNVCTEGIYNMDGFLSVMASKVAKSIAFGATWVQMETYMEKEADRAIGVRDDDY